MCCFSQSLLISLLNTTTPIGVNRSAQPPHRDIAAARMGQAGKSNMFSACLWGYRENAG
jgi:hypothetical protein